MQLTKYTYFYKTSDGVRHEDVIEALSREVVFESLRARGIRPIKVVAADGSKANGEIRVVGVKKRIVLVFVLIAAAMSALIMLSIGKFRSLQSADVGERKSMHQVKPLPRMEIRGDRERISNVPASLFGAPLETYLSKFAEPGRPIDTNALPRLSGSSAEDITVLERPICAADDELTEYEELMRITVSLKREMLDYIRGGGTKQEYLDELFKRQRLEISYRDNAERKISEMLADSVTPEQDVYDFWLKANARLQSMGIYSIPLPPVLRGYQSLVDLDE